MADYQALADEVYAAFTKADYAAIDRLFTEDYVEHSEFPGTTQDREGVKQFIRMNHEAFSDFTIAAEQVVSAKGRAAVLFRITGRHTGPFLGLPPTGRRIEVHGLDLAAINADGRVTEHWGYFEEMSLMQQLGAIPEQRTVDVTETTKTRA